MVGEEHRAVNFKAGGRRTRLEDPSKRRVADLHSFFHPFRSPSLNTFATKERLEVSRTVDHPKNLQSVRAWAVEYERLFKARHSKDSQRCNARVLEATIPSHFRLCGEERKRVLLGPPQSFLDRQIHTFLVRLLPHTPFVPDAIARTHDFSLFSYAWPKFGASSFARSGFAPRQVGRR
jgi:hypothetical protein